MASSSAFWFYGRLEPTSATLFEVHEFPVSDGVVLEVEHDGFAVWTRPPAGAVSSFADAVQLARETIRVTVAAYALISGTALDWSLSGWIEATSAQFDRAVVGFTVDPRGRLPTHSERSDDMLKAAALAVSAEENPAWRLAIRDVYAALLERSDDAFVFAYRAIEDAVRAVSGRALDLRASDWRLLHKHLAMTEPAFKSRIAALQTAREAAAHGDASDPRLIEARLKHYETVGIGRSVVADAIARDSVLPLGTSDSRLERLGWRRA